MISHPTLKFKTIAYFRVQSSGFRVIFEKKNGEERVSLDGRGGQAQYWCRPSPEVTSHSFGQEHLHHYRTQSVLKRRTPHPARVTDRYVWFVDLWELILVCGFATESGWLCLDLKTSRLLWTRTVSVAQVEDHRNLTVDNWESMWLEENTTTRRKVYYKQFYLSR